MKKFRLLFVFMLLSWIFNCTYAKEWTPFYSLPIKSEIIKNDRNDAFFAQDGKIVIVTDRNFIENKYLYADKSDNLFYRLQLDLPEEIKYSSMSLKKNHIKCENETYCTNENPNDVFIPIGTKKELLKNGIRKVALSWDNEERSYYEYYAEVYFISKNDIIMESKSLVDISEIIYEYYKSNNSQMIKETIEKINNNDYIKIISTYINCKYSTNIPDNCLIFTDFPKEHWSNPYVCAAINKSLILGYDDNTFRPENNMTRAEFCKIFVKAFDMESTNSNNNSSYPDLPTTHWAYNYIIKNNANYYLPPRENGLYEPDVSITRLELALAIYEKMEFFISRDYKSAINFSDLDGVSNANKKKLEALSEARIINGYEDGTFRPDAPIKRSEVCTILSKSFDIMDLKRQQSLALNGGKSSGVPNNLDLKPLNKNIDNTEQNNSQVIEKNSSNVKTIADFDVNELFKDKLSWEPLLLDSTTKNYYSNFDKIAKLLNGKIIMPNETFSFNELIGDATLMNGYLEDEAQYVYGPIEFASLLYYATLNCDLEIVERHANQMHVKNTTAGADACVKYGSLDFKFKNNKNYPIRIDLSYKDRFDLYIYGTKEGEYTTSGYVDVKSIWGYGTQKREDASMYVGEERVIQEPDYGYLTETYIIYKDNTGKEVNRKLVSKDTYPVKNKIILTGTKPVDKKYKKTKDLNFDDIIVEKPTKESLRAVGGYYPEIETIEFHFYRNIEKYKVDVLNSNNESVLLYSSNRNGIISIAYRAIAGESYCLVISDIVDDLGNSTPKGSEYIIEFGGVGHSYTKTEGALKCILVNEYTKLDNTGPKIIEAYIEGEITNKQVIRFTINGKEIPYGNFYHSILSEYIGYEQEKPLNFKVDLLDYSAGTSNPVIKTIGKISFYYNGNTISQVGEKALVYKQDELKGQDWKKLCGNAVMDYVQVSNDSGTPIAIMSVPDFINNKNSKIVGTIPVGASFEVADFGDNLVYADGYNPQTSVYVACEYGFGYAVKAKNASLTFHYDYSKGGRNIEKRVYYIINNKKMRELSSRIFY